MGLHNQVFHSGHTNRMEHLSLLLNRNLPVWASHSSRSWCSRVSDHDVLFISFPFLAKLIRFLLLAFSFFAEARTFFLTICLLDICLVLITWLGRLSYRFHKHLQDLQCFCDWVGEALLSHFRVPLCHLSAYMLTIFGKLSLQS